MVGLDAHEAAGYGEEDGILISAADEEKLWEEFFGEGGEDDKGAESVQEDGDGGAGADHGIKLESCTQDAASEGGNKFLSDGTPDDKTSGANTSDDKIEDAGDHGPGAENANNENKLGADSKTNNDHQGEAKGDEGTEKKKAGNSKAGSNKTSNSWEYEVPPLVLNYEALKYTADHFLPGSHGACIDITTIRRGGFHEIRELHFEDGWSCIGRFNRELEKLAKTQGEIATMEYVRKHTRIPVPAIYYVNYNENHVVGAAFELIEKMPGVPLSHVWDDLSLEHLQSIMEQTADVIGQLADLRFDKIGSLTADGTVGPLVNMAREFYEEPEGPFSTTLDFFRGGLNEARRNRTKGAMALYPEVKAGLAKFLEGEGSNPTLHAPYVLIHDDPEVWNYLVTQEDETQPPRISAAIDWDWAWVGPLHYLYDYPPETIDYQMDEAQYPNNKILRKHYVKTLAQRYPKGSADRENVKRCFRERSNILNTFKHMFAKFESENEDHVDVVCIQGYLKELRGEFGIGEYNHPYGQLEEYVVDSDPETDDE